HVFFFQAEDGIRGLIVTGVQTCALPISTSFRPLLGKRSARCSTLSDSLPQRTVKGKEPTHDEQHRAPAPGSDLLHPRLGKPEDEDRITQRIADLEVTTGRDGNELLTVQLVHRGR